ncbi:MAG TPA: cupin domain-containing protein [Stellaceae bacterium]|jgi:mannose-6-phosphate isomerase-like protein (cupin superfamily)|nr:cupin domain-containing protein [Stellaceae bacterium]
MPASRAKPVISLAEGRTAPIPAGRRSAELMTHGSLEIRFYAPRGRDEQTPHTRDEVYVVIHGRGQFFRDGERTPFGPGDLIFVAAGAEHRFEDFTDDLETWVGFYGPEGGERSKG